MISGKKVLGIITARGGSKGLQGKNILNFCGKPLIYWTIDTAQKSKYLDKIILSTDDKKIAAVASKYGCEVPFIRPSILATDKSSSIDVVIHALDFLKKEGSDFDYIALLEPTSPLRQVVDIDTAIETLFKNTEIADSIIGVSKVEAAHPVFDVEIGNNGLIKPYIDEKFKFYRRQDIKELYFFEGTIYVSLISALIDKKSFYHERTLPYFVPRWKSIEIDEEIDMVIAEAIFKKFKRGN